MENHVYAIVDQKGYWLCEDPCGWPVFDKTLCGRTTRYTKAAAENYIKALEKNKITGLLAVKIA